MRKLNHFWDLFQSIEHIRLDGYLVFGDDLKHTLPFFRRAYQGTFDAYVPEDKLGKGDVYCRGLGAQSQY